MTNILDMINLTQIAFGVLLIAGLLMYVAFFKESPKERRSDKGRH